MKQHIINIPEDRKGTAPFNFVSLGEKIIPAVSNPDELPDQGVYLDEARYHSGYFEVLVETLTPLYIRGPLPVLEFLYQQDNKYIDGEPIPEDENPEFRRLVKNSPNFFYYTDPSKPVIPGSSLRGMIRNIVEIVSYSKVNFASEKQLFYRTVDGTALGRYYNKKFVGRNGTKGNGYYSLSKGGFVRLQNDGTWKIESCVVGRVEERDIARAFGLSNPSDLYDGTGPSSKPKWKFQQKEVWVSLEPSERDHPHSRGKFLRYRKVTKISISKESGLQKGTLVLTGPVPRKHMAFVFVQQAKPHYYTLPEHVLEIFSGKEQITQWQASAFPMDNPSANIRSQSGNIYDGEPIFYLEDNDEITFIGHPQLFRMPYRNSPRDLVPENLRRMEIIDFADAIFGFVRSDEELREMESRGVVIPPQGSKGRAYAGRVYFTDAVPDPKEIDFWLSEEPIVPPILASPKPTAFQEYLVQNTTDKGHLKHYDSDNETEIRGHKMYWFKGQVGTNDLKPVPGSPGVDANTGEVDAHSSQHTQMKPVKTRKKFRFRIYFENLTLAEIGTLYWALKINGRQDIEYAHHLGMGKPFGMGALRLTPELRIFSRQKRYKKLFEQDEQFSTAVSIVQDPIAEFEKFILMTLGYSANTKLSELPRIKELLEMLTWTNSGQNKAKKQYAELSKFRERPVLPTPFGVWSKNKA